MQKIKYFVCETLADDFAAAVAEEGYKDVSVVSYPCLCLDKSRKAEADTMIDEFQKNDEKILIQCNRECEINKTVEKLNDKKRFQVHTTSYCFNYLISEKFVEYIVENEGYIVTCGWLKNWYKRLENSGFNKENARSFYGDFCKEIVFLDTQIDSDSLESLKSFSDYVNIPYRIINIGLDTLRLNIRSAVMKVWMEDKDKELDKLNENLKLNAEYSATLSIIEKIAVYTKKREVIEKVKELFLMVFGAKKYHYFDTDNETLSTDTLDKAFVLNKELEYYISEGKNEIVVKVEHQNQIFGVMVIGDFLFPENIKKYANFALSIARISALVIANAKQFEQLEKSKEDMTFVSHHDSLTGLYNRHYFNIYMEGKSKVKENIAVFMCDLDNLKKANDEFGHQVGDALIRSAADTLRKSFRDTDIIIRFGGDEFVVVVEDCPTEMAETFLQRINDNIVTINKQKMNKTFDLSISVGYSISVGRIINWNQLLNQADEKMYAVKAAKKAAKNNT